MVTRDQQRSADNQEFACTPCKARAVAPGDQIPGAGGACRSTARSVLLPLAPFLELVEILQGLFGQLGDALIQVVQDFLQCRRDGTVAVEAVGRGIPERFEPQKAALRHRVGEGAICQDSTIFGSAITTDAGPFSFMFIDNCAISGSIESDGNDVLLVRNNTVSGSIKSKFDGFAEITDNVVDSVISVELIVGDCFVDGNVASDFKTSGCTGTNP